MPSSVEDKMEEARDKFDRAKRDREGYQNEIDSLSGGRSQNFLVKEPWYQERLPTLTLKNHKVEESREEYVAVLLESLEHSSNKLKESSEKQVVASMNLEKSSRRLEAISGALLLFTAAVTVFTAESVLLQVLISQGLSPKDAWGYAQIGVYVVVGIITVALGLLLRMHLRRGEHGAA